VKRQSLLVEDLVRNVVHKKNNRKVQTETHAWVIKYAKYSDILGRAKQKWGNYYVMGNRSMRNRLRFMSAYKDLFLH